MCPHFLSLSLTPLCDVMIPTFDLIVSCGIRSGIGKETVLQSFSGVCMHAVFFFLYCAVKPGLSFALLFSLFVLSSSVNVPMLHNIYFIRISSLVC